MKEYVFEHIRESFGGDLVLSEFLLIDQFYLFAMTYIYPAQEDAACNDVDDSPCLVQLQYSPFIYNTFLL